MLLDLEEKIDRKEKGVYVLGLTNTGRHAVKVGALGDVGFNPSGRYCYVGSAMSGLRHRIARHLRVEKKTRWHLDWISPVMLPSFIILARTFERVECTLSGKLHASGRFVPVPRFGNGDCSSCVSHLYEFTGSGRGAANEGALAFLSRTFEECGLEPVILQPRKRMNHDDGHME